MSVLDVFINGLFLLNIKKYETIAKKKKKKKMKAFQNILDDQIVKQAKYEQIKVVSFTIGLWNHG